MTVAVIHSNGRQYMMYREDVETWLADPDLERVVVMKATDVQVSFRLMYTDGVNFVAVANRHSDAYDLLSERAGSGGM